MGFNTIEINLVCVSHGLHLWDKESKTLGEMLFIAQYSGKFWLISTQVVSTSYQEYWKTEDLISCEYTIISEKYLLGCWGKNLNIAPKVKKSLKWNGGGVS